LSATVNGPWGATSIPSKASRPSSVRGSATRVGCTDAESDSTFTSAAAGVISVVPSYSLTLPVTSTWSPVSTARAAEDP
jgi:hypothetical protein